MMKMLLDGAKEKRQSMEKDNTDAAVEWFGELVRHFDNAIDSRDLDNAIDCLQKIDRLERETEEAEHDERTSN